jgi:transcriptional regulator with XRE-family HTH domain
LKTLSSDGQRIFRATLKKVRLQAKLSQPVLAKRLGKPQSYVSKVESGERKCDPDEGYDWAEACDTEPLYLFSLYCIDMVRDRLARSAPDRRAGKG